MINLVSNSDLQQIYKAIFGLLTLLCFLSFYWSVIGVFRKPSAAPSKMYRFLQTSSAVTWVYSLFSIYKLVSFNLLVQSIAFVMSGFSLFLFWKTRRYISTKDFAIVFNSEKPSHLEVGGPFRWVRHPFYSSYLLCYLSVLVFTFDPVMIGLFGLMFTVYFRAYKGEEERFLSTPFENEYSTYAKRTGALIPRIRPQQRCEKQAS